MSLKKLPEIKALNAPVVTAFDISESAIEAWDASIAPSAMGDAVISIFGEIGFDGNDPKRIAAALRSIGEQDVIVEINSQGGNYFDGVAIYNQLRSHPHKVTVRVVGVAASAASVIAMAGDEILLAKSGSIMIHNCSAVIVANRLELVGVINNMEKFDAAMAGIYAERTGVDVELIAGLMDAETHILGPEAIEMGIADDYLPSDEIKRVSSEDARPIKAIARLEAACRRQGMPRSESRALLADAKGATHDAGLSVKHDADEITAEAVAGLFKIDRKERS